MTHPKLKGFRLSDVESDETPHKFFVSKIHHRSLQTIPTQNQSTVKTPRIDLVNTLHNPITQVVITVVQTMAIFHDVILDSISLVRLVLLARDAHPI
jgi:hypothetical protein